MPPPSLSPLQQARKMYLYQLLQRDGEVDLMEWARDKSIPDGWTTQQFHQAADDLLVDGMCTIDCHMVLRPNPPRNDEEYGEDYEPEPDGNSPSSTPWTKETA